MYVKSEAESVFLYFIHEHSASISNLTQKLDN